MNTELAEITAAMSAASAALGKATEASKIAVFPSGKPWKKRKADKAEEAEPKELVFADLTGWLDGKIVQEMPTAAKVSETRCLFYRAAVNEIHGEPSVGKTNILCAAIIAEVLAGGSVLVLDPEDTAQGFVSKLRALCCDDPKVISAIREGRVNYVHNPEPDDFAPAQEWAAENKQTMVILDGLAEALAAEGLNEDVPGDVLSFFRRQIRPFAEKAGAAVVIADHVAKAKDSGAWSRGSGAKLGRYDGVSYDVRLGSAYSPTVHGYVKMIVAKDRKGGVGPKGAHVADLHFSPADGGTKTEWVDIAHKPAAEVSRERSAEVESRIIEHLELHGACSKSDLRRLGGNGQTIDRALDSLLRQHRVTVDQSGRAHRYALAGGKLDEKPTRFAGRGLC